MQRTSWLVLAALATSLLGACAGIDSALERGVELRPGRSVRVTLPPEWTPIVPAQIAASPEATLEPTLVPAPALDPEGPWLLYCDVDDRAVLVGQDGPGRRDLGISCPYPYEVSGAAGFALVDSGLVQFPTGEEVRVPCCDAAGWSTDGSVALLSTAWQDNTGSELIAYDVATDRFREIASSDYQIRPMGVSPNGTWAVYLDYDGSPETPPTRRPPGQVLAVSTDGQTRWRLYDVYGPEVVFESVLGWLSESILLIQHSDWPCNLEPHHLELTHVNLYTGAARHIFDTHSYIAFDPTTQTVLLEELPRGQCSIDGHRGPLVRLSAADGWQPHRVALPAEWGDDWRISQIEWHPELGRFSVRISGNLGGVPLRLITLDTEGTIWHDFSFEGEQIVVSANLFPSPDGALIVVAASPSFGTRLYDRDGQPVKQLILEGGEPSWGVERLIWLPDGLAFFMTQPEAAGLYKADAYAGWGLTLVDPAADDTTSLTLVEAPALPFRQTCGGQAFTRLYLGDRVVISHEPPFPSRLRSTPGLAGSVVGTLEPGDEAEIIGSSACSDGFVWWYLYDLNSDLKGWAAEGDAEGAWLLPTGSSQP